MSMHKIKELHKIGNKLFITFEDGAMKMMDCDAINFEIEEPKQQLIHTYGSRLPITIEKKPSILTIIFTFEKYLVSSDKDAFNEDMRAASVVEGL